MRMAWICRPSGGCHIFKSSVSMRSEKKAAEVTEHSDLELELGNLEADNSYTTTTQFLALGKLYYVEECSCFIMSG